MDTGEGDGRALAASEVTKHTVFSESIKSTVKFQPTARPSKCLPDNIC